MPLALAEKPQAGMSCKIPVRNLWLLMLYASELRHAEQARCLAAEENPDELPNLVAEILTSRVDKRLKRNLSSGYVERMEVLSRVRGRIDMLYTQAHRLLSRGRIACRYSELTNNTPRNCFVRAALEHLSGMVSKKDLAHKCRSLALTMQRSGVTGTRPPASEGSIFRFGRHDSDDRQMVYAAKLAFEMNFPSEESGQYYIFDPLRDIHWLRSLYEKGIRGFYEAVLTPDGWSVSGGRRLNWQIVASTERISDCLPGMKTDIILEKGDKRIVIDTKFTSILTAGRFREDCFKSGHIYQLYAYLMSQQDVDTMADSAEGMLLYPAIGAEVDESVTIQGHRIRFATVDLAADTAEIRRRLLELTGERRFGVEPV